MSEKRDNSGALFKNDRRENERQPEYSGNCIVGGKAYWISAWVKQSAGGNKFFSFAFRPKEEKEAKPAEPAGEQFEDDKELPF